MDRFAGLDVSVKDTSVCIVDDTRKIIREVKVASEPEALSAVLKSPAYHFFSTNRRADGNIVRKAVIFVTTTGNHVDAAARRIRHDEGDNA
jgi:hypothetical protein